MIDRRADPTLSDILKDLEGSPARFALLWSITQTHDQRFTLIEEIMDQCYVELVEKRQGFHGLSEDQLSLILCGMISFTGASVNHDAQIGGHVDVVVRGPSAFLWIGEAKIYRGAATVMGGFLQLSTRYGVAGAGRDHGEIIIYNRQSNSQKALQDWRDHLVAEKIAELTDDRTDTADLAFRTKHICPSTGLAFYVRHRIVSLYFQPKK